MDPFATSLDIVLRAFAFVWTWFPVWFPILLIYGFWRVWMAYVRAKYLATEKVSLLEIKLPKEITKSPMAMEIILNNLYNTLGETTFINRNWEGKVRTWFSLEMASFEGDIKFFIWTWKKNSQSVQNHIYSQYPNVEINEVEDYTTAVLYDTDEIDIFGGELALAKPDPYPLKTYIDYGLDKDPKEEFKLDPMTPVIEFLGSLGPGQQAWLQILIRAHKDEDFAGEWYKPWTWMKTTDKWKDEVQVQVDKIIKGRKIQVPSAEEGDEKIMLTDMEKDTISALQRSVAKLPFDTAVRYVYVAKQDAFRKDLMGGFFGTLRQFGADNLNGFKPLDTTSFDYPWEDFRDYRLAKRKRRLFEGYRRRSAFHPPYKLQTFVLNTEELATLYHFPGDVAQTPTFSRIDSRKSEPPTNLPM